MAATRSVSPISARKFYGSDFPASTLLTAASFAVPEIMVEITPIAVVAG